MALLTYHDLFVEHSLQLALVWFEFALSMLAHPWGQKMAVARQAKSLRKFCEKF
jgi:hypothetical protein